MKIQTWHKDATSQLAENGIESARLDSLLLLEDELKKPRSWLLAHDDEQLSSKILKNLNNKLAQRTARIPLAYITNSKEFYGRNFYVNEGVLIPRPESEAMIELLNQVMAVDSINTVFDIGTGSGCLAITCKLEHPNLHVTASDISPSALRVAKSNASRLEATVRFVQSDLLESVSRMPKTRPYVILANLPYVPEGLITSEEITKEPALALFSGSDGLNHYRKLWDQVNELKNKPVYIITESLEHQQGAMTELAKARDYKLHSTSVLAQCFYKN